MAVDVRCSFPVQGSDLMPLRTDMTLTACYSLRLGLHGLGSGCWSHKREGSPHRLRFKVSVIAGGQAPLA